MCFLGIVSGIEMNTFDSMEGIILSQHGEEIWTEESCLLDSIMVKCCFQHGWLWCCNIQSCAV